jgi:hypothetical protein
MRGSDIAFSILVRKTAAAKVAILFSSVSMFHKKLKRTAGTVNCGGFHVYATTLVF